jgi:flagellar biosynthesis/type III secretory pathway protein FliH
MGLVVLTQRHDWRLASESKILDQGEVKVVEKAADLMRSAEDYATRVLRTALKVYDLRADQGFEAGVKRAEAAAGERLAALEAARASLFEQLRPSMTDLLLDAMARLATGVPRDRLYASAVEAIEEAWSHARWARMHVHPQDVAAAQQALLAMTTQGNAALSITVVADEAVAPAGCRFESDLGFAEAGLQVQMDALCRALSGGAEACAQRLHDIGTEGCVEPDGAFGAVDEVVDEVVDEADAAALAS